MESLSLGTDQTYLLNSVQVLKCKYDGMAFTILSSILAIMLALLVVVRYPHPTDLHALDLSLEVTGVLLILLINPISYLTARSISKLVTSDGAQRKSVTWVVHRGTSQMAMTSLILVQVILTCFQHIK